MGPAFIEEGSLFLRVFVPKNIFPKTLPVREQVHSDTMSLLPSIYEREIVWLHPITRGDRKRRRRRRPSQGWRPISHLLH